MNLTWELRQGTVGSWCRRVLADVAALQLQWQTDVASVSTRRPRQAGPDGPDWARLGAAIHHRVGFGFGANPPMAAFHGLALLDGTPQADALVDAFDSGRRPGVAASMSGPLDFAVRLGQFVAGYDLATVQPAGVERTLAKALWVLALWEDVYRAGPAKAHWWPPDTTDTAVGGWDAPVWLELAPDYAVTDLVAVAEAFTRRGRPGLIAAAGSGDVVVGPVYAPGWADADLKLGACLIEVKATVHPDRLDPMWVWQLCCYAWLDGHVDSIAVHLPRQGHTVVFDLATVVETISHGGDPDVIAGQGRAVMREAAASAGKPIL